MERTIKWILWLAAIGLLIFVGWRFVVVKNAGATEVVLPEACNHQTTYTDSDDEDHSRVNVNFQDSDEAITITAKSGFALVKVELDVEDDTHVGYYDYTNQITSGVKFNPNPGGDIDHAKVTVKKVCREVCNDEVALNYEPVVIGQTVANNKLCEYTPAGQCPTACGLEASEVPDGEGGYLKCDATPACPPAEGVCPTECGKLADYVADGQGGQKYCPATPLCNGPVGAPQCPNGVPATPPANAHVVRNGSSATVNAHIPEGDRANIYFKENGADGWKHAVRDIPVTGKYLSYTINDLNPKLGYTFAVQASSGCAGGELVSVVVDPPANGKTFMFSYFDWLD